MKFFELTRYTSKELYRMPRGTGIILHKFQTVKLKNTMPEYFDSYGKALFFRGNYFLLDLTFPNMFYHLVIDVIGSYLYLKSYIPDLKMLAIVSSEDEDDYAKNNIAIQYAKLFDANIVYGRDFHKITINSLYVIKNNQMFSLNGNINPKSLGNIEFDLAGGLRPGYVDPKTFRQFFDVVIPEAKKIANSLPDVLDQRQIKKIFIDRRSESIRIRNNAALVGRYLRGELTKEDSLSDAIDVYDFLKQSGLSEKEMVLDRVISPEDEKTVMDFFVNIGYEVVNMSKISVVDQIKLFRGATHIAGYTGAGFANTIYCNKDCHVTIINPHSSYTFWHGANANASCPGNVIQISCYGNREIDNPKVLSTQEIIDELILYKDFL